MAGECGCTAQENALRLEVWTFNPAASPRTSLNLGEDGSRDTDALAGWVDKGRTARRQNEDRETATQRKDERLFGISVMAACSSS